MSENKWKYRASPSTTSEDDFGSEQEDFLGTELANLAQTLERIRTALDNSDARSIFEKAGSVAEKYKKNNSDAKKYVRGVKSFASDTVRTFEGLQSDCSIRKEVFQDFAKGLKASQQDLLAPLKAITATSEDIADGVSDLATESGLLANEYEQAGRRYETGVYAAAVSTLGVGLLELYLGGTPACSVLMDTYSEVVAQPVASLCAYKRDEMKRKEVMLRSLNNELSQVARIIEKQQLLLHMICDIIGPYMSKMHSRAERRLASGTPTTLTEDKITKVAKELEALCSSFQEDY